MVHIVSSKYIQVQVNLFLACRKFIKKKAPSVGLGLNVIGGNETPVK